MYQRIEDFSLHILAAVLIANALTAVAAWYEIYYVVNDSTTATIKAILVNAAASAALGIYIVSTVDTYMVLSKLILEKYLNNRFNAGLLLEGPKRVRVGKKRQVRSGGPGTSVCRTRRGQRGVAGLVQPYAGYLYGLKGQRGEAFDEPPPDLQGKQD